MADSKITALTSISTSTDPANDPLVIVDVSDTSMAATGTTKKVTLNQLLGASGTATLASAAITGDLTVDTSTLKVDSANNRVGIVTATPATALDVNGDITQRNGSGTIIGNIQNSSGLYDVKASANVTGLQLSTAAATPIIFALNNVEAMRLNSTGLGVGKTPLARLDVASTRAASVIGGIVGTTGTGVVNDECQFLIKNVNTASGQNNGAGIGGLLEASASNKSSLLFYVDNGTAVTNVGRFDSNGNLGIGVTPNTWTSYKALQVQGASIFSTTGNDTAYGSNFYYDGAYRFRSASSDKACMYSQFAGQHQWHYTASAGTAGNVATFTQAMTLDASGNLLVGTTSNGITNTNSHNFSKSGYIGVSHASTPTGDYYLAFGYNGSIIGSITQNGTTGVLYNITSDYRLKEQVQPLVGGLARVNALKPSVYKWKSDGSNGEGFLAHELAEVVPFAVSGEKDAVNEDGSIKSQGIDMSRVVPILVAAIQELTARVQTLETR